MGFSQDNLYETIIQVFQTKVLGIKANTFGHQGSKEVNS